MFSRILTFSVLSVFCVLTAISSVYAHQSKDVSYHNYCHDHNGYGEHCHVDAVHYHADGTPHFKTGFEHENEHNSNSVNILRVGRPHGENVHTHSVESHQHDPYVWHTHTLTHDHPDSEHPHSSDYPYRVTHAGVGRQTTTDTQETPEDTSSTRTPPAGGGGGTPAGPTGTSTPASTTVGGGSTTEVEESGTSEGTSSLQPVGPVATQSAPQERQPEPPPIQPIRVTEYMVRDWSKGAVIGNSNLPQWIELYNPNIEAVNLKGWTFQYATRRFRNQPYKVHTLTLAATEDGFSIPGGGVVILATQRLPARKFSGIEVRQVYNLNIENVLKRGWVLTNADDKEIQRLGREAFSALRDPVAPPHQDGVRVSYQVYLSESPSEPYYYGDSGDIGAPGFYKQPAPAAPSLIRPKRVGTWADLKR